MNLRRIFAAAAMLCVSAPVFAEGSSPWLPAPGSSYVEFEYYRQAGDQLYRGSTLSRLSNTLSQNAYFLSGEHGITDKFSIDARIGYSASNISLNPARPPSRQDGLSDTHFGFRYNLLDEFDKSPVTVTFRAAGIIGGNYEAGKLESIGDGASGAEVGFIFGKIIGEKLSVSLQTIARFRLNNVPPEAFAAGSVGYAITNRVTIFGGASYNGAFTRLDIGDRGFTKARLPEVDEDFADWSGGMAFNLGKGVSLSGSYGKRFYGRNSTKTNQFRIAIGYSF